MITSAKWGQWLAIDWLLYTNLQNKILCWLLSTNLQNKTGYKQVTLFAMLRKSQHKYVVSNLGWKLSPVIDKRGRDREGVQKKLNEHHYWILNIWIRLSTTFQLRLTIVIFWTKFAKNGSYFQSKTDKIDTTIEFCIFRLVFVSIFTLSKQFWIFRPNMPKRYLC